MYHSNIANMQQTGQGNDNLRNHEKGGGAYGSIPKDCGSLQNDRFVTVLPAAGLQERLDPAHQERRRILHQCPGADGDTGYKAGKAFGILA